MKLSNDRTYYGLNSIRDRLGKTHKSFIVETFFKD